MLQCHPCRQLHLEWLPLTHYLCGSLRTWWTCGHQGQGIAGRTVSPPAPTPSTSTCTAPAAPGQTLLSSCKGEVVLKFCTPVCPTHTHTHTHTQLPVLQREGSTALLLWIMTHAVHINAPHPTPPHPADVRQYGIAAIYYMQYTSGQQTCLLSCRGKAVQNCCNILQHSHINTTTTTPSPPCPPPPPSCRGTTPHTLPAPHSAEVRQYRIVATYNSTITSTQQPLPPIPSLPSILQREGSTEVLQQITYGTLQHVQPWQL